MPIIGTFQSRYKSANVSISVSERLLDFVDDSLDLSFRVAPTSNPDYVTLPLLRYRHVMVAAPHYLASNGSPQKPDDLERHNLLGFGFHGKAHITWSLSPKNKGENKGAKQDDKPENRQEDKKRNQRKVEQKVEHSFKSKISVNDYSAVFEATKMGLGIGELPSILCREAIDNGQLIEVLSDWTFPVITLSAVHPGSQRISRLARIFLDICKEHFRPK